MKSVRLYGFLDDYGSFAQVTRGFAEAFRQHGYDKRSLDVVSLEREATFDEEPTGIPLADVGIVTGPPNAAGKMTQGAAHERRFVMVHPNSTKLPERMMHTVNTNATALLTASAWGKSVLERYTDKPVLVVPLGITQDFRPKPVEVNLDELYEAGNFSILHLSSSDGQRKGTVELVRAFLAAFEKRALPEYATLRLVLTPRGFGQAIDLLSDLKQEGAGWRGVTRVLLTQRFGARGLAPQLMSEIYGGAHVVCQPSRGEGFGMVPLEALASGVPIVATTVTGHAEWFREGLPGAVPIATTALAPIDDMPGAEAPGIAVADVERALCEAFVNWKKLKAEAIAAAPRIVREWAWEKKLASFINETVNEGKAG